jgi:Flp pilus assembly pilin Flp
MSDEVTRILSAIEKLKQLRHREEGVSMAEYALLLALVTISLMIAIIAFRNEISNSFNSAQNRIQHANNQAAAS